MATDRYSEILQHAQQDLTPEEQQKLADALRKKPKENNESGEQRTLYDALNERGLIGSITDAPSDLSTNPIHMEGFGKHDR